MPNATDPSTIDTWLLLATRFTRNERALRVRCGPFRSRMELAGMRAVTPTRNPLAGLARSLQRRAISHGTDRLTPISPRDQAALLRDLGARRQAIARSATA